MALVVQLFMALFLIMDMGLLNEKLKQSQFFFETRQSLLLHTENAIKKICVPQQLKKTFFFSKCHMRLKNRSGSIHCEKDKNISTNIHGEFSNVILEMRCFSSSNFSLLPRKMTLKLLQASLTLPGVHL